MEQVADEKQGLGILRWGRMVLSLLEREESGQTDREGGKPEPKAGWWSLVGLTHRESYWIGSERGVVSRPAWRSLNFPWETAL